MGESPAKALAGPATGGGDMVILSAAPRWEYPVAGAGGWENTGYYAWDRDEDVEIKENDVVCIDRGAFVQGGFTGYSAKNATIQVRRRRRRAPSQ